MRSVKIIKTLLLVLALPILAGAATRRFVVQLSTEPAARFASRSFGQRKESLARPEVAKHRTTIRTEQDSAEAEIRKLGGRVVERTDTASNTLIIDLPEENLAKLSSIPGVKTSHRTRSYKPMLDQANLVHKFPQAYTQVGGASNAGAGIKIAMIDSGIDITQPAFSDTGFQAPSGYPIASSTADLKLTNNKVIVARSYVSLLSVDPNSTNPPEVDFGASDELGHGTITASCAAGGTTVANVATFTGAAPGAYLGNYKVFGTPGTTSDGAQNEGAILKAIDDSVKDGMDIISYSLGGFPPTPASQDLAAQSLNSAVAAGVIVVAAAGNDGNGLDSGYFYDSADFQASTIPDLVSSDGAQNVIQVGASSNQRAFGPMLTVGTQKYLLDTEYSLTTDANNNPLVFSGAPVIDVATLDGTGQACNALPQNSLTGAIGVVSLNGFDPNQDTCDPDEKMDNLLAAGAVGGIIYDNFPEDIYDIYSYYGYWLGYQFLYYTNLPSAFITYTDGQALVNQLAAQTGVTGTLDFSSNSVPVSSDRVAFLSSRGPNSDFEIKPDMVAVGEDLLTATETVNACDPSLCFYDASGLYYPANGTSGSTPLVSGAAAILKAARPGLSALQYRSLLINSTARISDAVYGGYARVMDAGAGTLDVNAALNAEATVVPASVNFGIGDGSATVTKSITITNSGSATDTFTLTAVPRDPGFVPQLDQSSLTLDPSASATVNVTIPGGVLTAGEYEGAIHVQGNNTATDTHVMYWFGVPSSKPYLLSDMGSDTQDAHGQLAPAALVFRVTDASGIYMTNILPQITVTYFGSYRSDGVTPARNGNPVVGTPYTLDSYSPGTIAVDITPSKAGSLYDGFTVTVGDPNNPTLSLDFYIYGY